jgi:hypothetical protein
MRKSNSFIYACNLCRGPPRFEGDRPRFGDRDGYRGGPRGAPGDFSGDKGGAPAEFQPSFRVIMCILSVFLFISFEHHDSTLLVHACHICPTVPMWLVLVPPLSKRASTMVQM